ncbi:hypothetical protein WMF37_52865 [Sorangium sp. So ce291]|uniref:hypothetical protein n=1 Tax=Sorangium sp. So ce291 TaxID=3133294 RepID=UPI003F64905B
MTSASPPSPAAYSDPTAGVIHEAAEQAVSGAAAVPPRASVIPTKRQQIYTQVHALHAQGLSLYAICHRDQRAGRRRRPLWAV